MAIQLSDFVVPDGIEPVVGWRAWRVIENEVINDEHKILLTSISEHMVWMPRERGVAECRLGREHIPPMERCRCGFYAARTRAHMESQTYREPKHDNEVICVGEVYLWGRVIPGDQGWKAQYAYPKRLLLPHAAWRYRAPLRAAYGVPVKFDNTIRDHYRV